MWSNSFHGSPVTTSVGGSFLEELRPAELEQGRRGPGCGDQASPEEQAGGQFGSSEGRDARGLTPALLRGSRQLQVTRPRMGVPT